MQIAENARNARSEDVYKIRTRGIRYILGKDFEATSFNPPLDPYGDKIQRGWNHIQTARALCPMHSIADFNIDRQCVVYRVLDCRSIHGFFRAYMDRVKDGIIKIKSFEFPSFLYQSNETYDPDDRGHGLLRGDALIRVILNQRERSFNSRRLVGLPPPLYWR